MATIRMSHAVWARVHHHLFSRPSEHFAFLLARHATSAGTPVLMVHDAMLIPDSQVTVSRSGWELSTQAILDVINAAVRSGGALIEVHNHGGERPRFSPTDRDGFRHFPAYVLESLPGRPYAATVWGDSTVYGEVFLPNGRKETIGSITVVGDDLRQIVSRDDDGRPVAAMFNRQLPWFTAAGQQRLGRLRVAVMGTGGTGSQVIQNLAYLGVRDFVLGDDDAADETNLNRMVTADAADLDIPKVLLGRRLIKHVAPDARVMVISEKVQSAAALDALKGVDAIFGCFDNDAPRLILNEVALAYAIPYFDLGVGIDAPDATVASAGGRVAIVLPDGPCLGCMGEIDPQEAAFFLGSADEQAMQIARGYVRDMHVPAPAVISLNAVVAAVAVNELAVFVSGLRPINPYTEVDLLGIGRPVKGQWMTPRRVRCDPGCIQCGMRGMGDRTGIERYVTAH